MNFYEFLRNEKACNRDDIKHIQKRVYNLTSRVSSVSPASDSPGCISHASMSIGCMSPASDSPEWTGNGSRPNSISVTDIMSAHDDPFKHCWTRICLDFTRDLPDELLSRIFARIFVFTDDFYLDDFYLDDFYFDIYSLNDIQWIDVKDVGTLGKCFRVCKRWCTLLHDNHHWFE